MLTLLIFLTIYIWGYAFLMFIKPLFGLTRHNTREGYDIIASIWVVSIPFILLWFVAGGLLVLFDLLIYKTIIKASEKLGQKLFGEKDE